MQEQLKLKPRPRDVAVLPNETVRPSAARRELRPSGPQLPNYRVCATASCARNTRPGAR
jgi:hypothetical protein